MACDVSPVAMFSTFCTFQTPLTVLTNSALDDDNYDDDKDANYDNDNDDDKDANYDNYDDDKDANYDANQTFSNLSAMFPLVHLILTS